MSEDNVYQDAEIVWVKLRSCWWPGEVCSHQRQPEGLLKHTKRKPYCVVKFFQEDSFEYVKNSKMIFPFNCSKKDEFIRKGHALLAKNKYMEQFPAAVSTAERLTRSVTRSSLFFNSRPDSIIKAILTDSPPPSERIRNGRQCEIVDKILQTTPTATTNPSQSPDLSPTYKCSICDFKSTRQNVMVLHRRSHSGTGTTPHRNSFLSRSITSPSNVKGSQKSPEIIKKDDDKAPTSVVKKVINETPVSKGKELEHEIKSRGDATEIESDLINTLYNKQFAKERPSKQNSDGLSTVFIRPPPKKQLNFINCKSESIQKSLLADWIDEDKEDEDDNEDAKQVEAAEIITTKNKINQHSSISLASTSASAEKLRNQESVDQKTALALIEPQKPTSKIRNIPKKDRRNIVFTDFNETEDIAHVLPSQSQKTKNDVCSEIHFNEEKDSSETKASILQITTLTEHNTELFIEEPSKTSSNAEEIPTSKIFAKEKSDKAKLTDEYIYSSKPSNKKKLPARKSTRHESKVLEASIEITRANMTPFQVKALQALNADKTLTVTAKQAHVEKNITNEANTTEPSTCNIVLVESDTLRPITDNLTHDLSAVKEFATYKIKVEQSTGELGTEQSTTLKETVVDLATDEPTTLKSTTVESKTVEFNKLEYNFVERNKTFPHKKVQLTTKESTLEPISVDLTLEEPTTEVVKLSTNKSNTEEANQVEPMTIDPTEEEQTSAELSTQEYTTVKPTSYEISSVKLNVAGGEPVTELVTAESSVLELSEIEPATVEPANVEPSIVESTIKESSNTVPSILEPSSVEPSLVAQSIVEPSTIEPSIVKLSKVDTSTVEPSTVVPSTGEKSTGEPSPVEPSTLELSIVETSTVEPSTVEPSTVEPSTVEPSTVEPSTVEPSTVEPSTVEPYIVEPFTVEPSTVEPSTEASSTVKPSTVEPSTVETFTVEPSTKGPSTVEPSAVAPSTLETSTAETSIVESSSVELSTVEPSTVEPSTVEPYTENPSTEEPSTVELSTVEPSTVEPSTAEPITPEPNTEILDTIEPIIEEIFALQSNLTEPNAVGSTATDETNPETEPFKVVPISLEKSGEEHDIVEIKSTVLKTAQPNEKKADPEESIAIDRPVVEQQRLQSVTDIFLNSVAQVSPDESPFFESSSDKFSTSQVTFTNEQSTEANPEGSTDVSSKKKTCTAELSIQDFSSDEKPASSTHQLKEKTSNTKLANTSFEMQPLVSSEKEYFEDKSDEKILKEKYSSADLVYSEIKLSDEALQVNAYRCKKNADVKKILKDKKPALRSSTPRGCKRDTFETKETFVKKKTIKPSAKKLKFMDKNSSAEEQTLDPSFETCKPESLTIDQPLTICKNEERLINNISTEKEAYYEDKANTSKSATEGTSIKTNFVLEEMASSLPILKSESEVLSNIKLCKSIKTDASTRVDEQPCMGELHTADKSDVVTNPHPDIINQVQSSESKPHVPVYLELEDANPVSELNESKPRSSFSKASLACFDFNEEEDILTSIANFKKTYISPEKSYNFGLDSGPKTPDAKKLELEMKDKQLTADIESLLKTTTLPANLASSSTATVSNRPFSNEVRGLPIKERGKRIFKSRNRFRFESCPSVSTTSTIEAKSVSSSILSNNKKEITPMEASKRFITPSQDIQNQNSAKENITTIHVEENVDDMPKIAKTMDDKVTNSEEEIIGRIVFPSSEIYATPNDEPSTESVQIRESLVSSSGMEVNSESLLISNENLDECNDNINSDVAILEETRFEKPTFPSESGEKDESNHNLQASNIESVGDENDEFNKKVSNQECNLMSDRMLKQVDQIRTEAFNNDLKQADDQENKSYTFESSIVDEENQVKDVDNKGNKPKLLDEDVTLIEDSGIHYTEENNEPVYDKELSVDEEIGKANDSNCESPFEYELVTTEVSTIVDHISNEEQNLENAKESSTEVSEEVVSCCDDGTFLNEMIIADVTESQSSVTENEIDNSHVMLKFVETESGGAIENPTDESNSCSINAMNSKIYENQENDIRDSNVEDERLQAEVEHAEASSDDSSSIISDAEAEFGSPTSMLEEERVLNRAISGSETPATSADGKAHRTLKKSSRKIRYQLQTSLKENKLIIQSLQCDTQESTSNDILNELAYDANKYESGAKERHIEDPKLFCDRTNSFSNKPLEKEFIEKETDSQENNELLGKYKERQPENEKDIVDSNYENSDSSEEDEEEICSPPIEPLLDEDTEAETIENYSTTTSLSKSEGGPQIDCDVAFTSGIVQEFQLDHLEKSKTEEEIFKEQDSQITKTVKDEPSADLNRNQSDSFYTITHKSDTIIKLNKHKEKSTHEMVLKGWTETNVDVRKSELAGEELSAAEALLLIPNQTTNVLENSSDLIKNTVESTDSSGEVENPQDLLADEEIKEETLECCEQVTSQDLELDNKGDIPKELVRRKRRSHMKVTPRKRVISTVKLEENLEESQVEAKLAKLENSPVDSGSKLVKSSDSPELQNKSTVEQYEDNFVLKYMKEQLMEEMESVESAKNKTEDLACEKQTLEKVHITVDISNPLSSQIATILGTNRPSSTELPLRSGVKKRKQSVEDDIPSFIIKRPCPKTIAEEEAADRETIAQIQNLCPQVEITRKSSKDDQNSSTPTSQQATTKPQIINQQILRAGNNQPLITVTAKGNKPEEGIFDISNMPIVLSNEKIVNEKVHLVITPTTNPQLIKQFQTQHQTQISNTSSSNFSVNTTASVPKPGIPVRRTSCVRTKRTPSRQQLPEQQQISEIQNFEQENYQQPIIAQQQQQQPHQQQEYAHSHQQLQQHQQQIQQEHNQLQQQRQNQQGQVQPQNQFQQQLQQQQFQHHHQNQIQQQLQEEQNILIQQHHQLMLQQQLQLQHHQHQVQNQHQLVTNEKASQSNLSEKQIGIDNRGNKYVIIRNPSNTVVMANSPEPCKVQQQRVPVTAESCDQSLQRMQRQKKHSPLTVQTGTSSKSPVPILPPLPDTSPPPHILSITSTQTNQPQQYFKDQLITSPSIPVTPAATTKPKGRGRGRPPKNKTETVSSSKQSTSSNAKVNANGRRSTGRICEPPRQRSTRSLAVTTPSEVHQTVMSSATVYPTNQQQTQSVGFMINPQFTSMDVSSSPSIHANNDSYQSQTLGLSPQSIPPTVPEISVEASEVSGGGYAVPSLPVPGYPQTYLLCELIGNKYKEVFSKPLYLSPDRTRFLEVPDELVTEAHTKLSDSRREPNPNALKLVSDGTPHILQSRLIEINSENMMNQNESNGQQNEVLMQKHQQLSVEEQASALLCLQEQLTQEHLVHKQISQEQLVQDRLVQDQLAQEQLVQEQFVEEQFVQEQFVQEQFVQEQFVQEQFVQEQFGQEQFVQEQFVQEQFVPEQFVQEQFNLQPQQFSLQLARFETGEVIEDAERGQMMVVSTGTHNMILDDKSFFEFTGEKKIDFYNAEKDTYVLTPQVISSLLHHYALGHITAVPALNTEMGDQQEVSIADVIQNADSSTNILEVALDESGLYSEEQFLNTGQILQIETPEGMQLIGTASENADLIFHHMNKANTNETNVLLNQAPKMSAVEIPSDKSKRRFETKPSTPATLEDCLNVIGVPIQSPNIPTSLELPASVTNPAIVAKTRTPTPGTITMNEIIATGLCHHPDITSLPSMSSNDQELSYEFFHSNTEAHEDKDQVNEESVVTDMGEYAVVTSSASFDDPGR